MERAIRKLSMISLVLSVVVLIKYPIELNGY